ncbi:MAG: 4Fe-4S binding protein [Verrucomicrobiota bacterium]|nr:4Fe-4S binding protein [Verrucomicrobiota bacterium]
MKSHRETPLLPRDEAPASRSAPLRSAIRKSKVAGWRGAALLVLNLVMVAHIVQWRITGRTVSPIEPSESMQTLQHGAVNAGFIFFSLAILATMLFGRFVCGWGCHILALQDACGWLMKKIGITPKPFRSRLLLWVPLLAALYMFVWPTVYRALFSGDNGPLVPSFTNHLVTDNFWATFPGPAVAIPFLFICGFLTVYFLGAKGFCTYACPYGGFFGVADKIAPGKIRVTDACEQCGHCTAVCTSNVLVHQEVRDFGMVVDPGCMKCMDCVSVCPKEALYFGFGKPTVLAAPRSAPAKRHYSLSWPGEIAAASVFLGSFLAVRGVYGAVPFLMALGCAAVDTLLAVKGWRLLQKQPVYLHQFLLRSDARIRPAGWAFLAFTVAALGLTAHSGWIRYHEYRGEAAFARLQIPDELALAQLNPETWMSPADRAQTAVGERSLRLASTTGLFTNGDALAKLGWFNYLAGEPERALQTLATAAAHQAGEAKALSLYYAGAIQNRLGHYADAKASLDRALAERPDLVLARQELGEALWQLGYKAPAIIAWTQAVQRSPGLALSSNFLAGAKQALGRLDEAAAHLKQGQQHTPDIAAYHWMLGQRLRNVGMNDIAAAHFDRAVELDPSYRERVAP